MTNPPVNTATDNPVAPTNVGAAGLRILLEREHLGAGTFLDAALAVSPAVDAPIVYLEKPYQPFFGGRTNALSLADLKRAVDAYAAFYTGHGVQPKDPVGIYLDDGVEYLVHYLALTALGAIPVLTNGNLGAEIAAEYFRRVGVVGLYLDQPHADLLQGHIRPRDGYRFVTTDDALRGTTLDRLPALGPDYPFQHQDQDPIMVAHSSGTTGVPKAVVLQHAPFFHGVRYRLEVSSTGGAERILSALPHSHNCAMAYIMLALLCGNPVYIASDHTGQNIAQRITEFRPSMVVAFPESYVQLTEADLPAFDLSSVRFWFNGGDAAHEQHIRLLIAHGHTLKDGAVQPGSLFVDGMGSSEMGFSLFRNVHGAGPSTYDRCVGTTIEWASAAVLSDDGTQLPAWDIGRLAVKAPSVTSGYWNNSALTFRSQLAGYFLTGDLAYHDGEGRFFHVDRVPDLVRTPDGPLYTLRTEELLLAHLPELADCSIVAAPLSTAEDAMQGGVLLARVRPGATRLDSDAALLQAANAVIRARGWPEVTAARIVTAQDIPLGTTGKVLKRLLRDRYRAFLVDGHLADRASTTHAGSAGPSRVVSHSFSMGESA